MPELVHLTPTDAAYPARLRALDHPPSTVAVQGGPLEASRAIAVVGSRAASPGAAVFAHELAATLADAGAVIVSGGAEGIDAAAHQGALDAKGRTWAVAGTGHGRCFPEAHATLFETIARGPGAMVWPFPDGYHGRSGFLARNRVLVALADAVVVVQAGLPSGALHAASWARKLNRPLWVVPAAPWLDEFAGSRRLLATGARMLLAPEQIARALLLTVPAAARTPQAHVPGRALSGSESAVLEATSSVACHADEIAARARLTAQAAAVTLLTLALEDVVVEGPPGFFRRTNASQTMKISG